MMFKEYRCLFRVSNETQTLWAKRNSFCIRRHMEYIKLTCTWKCQDSFIRSFRSLSYDRPLPKRVLHTVRSRASSFNFHYPLFSLRSSSSFLLLLLRLPVTSLSFHLSVNHVFYKAVSTQDVTNPVSLLLLLYVGYSFPPWLCVIVNFS